MSIADWLLAAPPPVYIVAVIVATLAFLPGSIAMMCGGFVYGFAAGSIYAAIAVALGAQAAFAAGRYWVRPWARRRFAANPTLRQVEAALEHEAFLIVLLTRLSLPLPYNLLNYVYGATAVSGGVHFVATALGMLPAVLLYVYLGSGARDIHEVLAGEASDDPLTRSLLIVGTLALLAAVWIIHRTATRVLRKHLDEETGSPP